MTGAGGSSGLADLITQAPPEAEKPDKLVARPPPRRRQSALGWLCRCVWPAAEQPRAGSKLASVVPVADGDKVQSTTRGRQPQSEQKAPVQKAQVQAKVADVPSIVVVATPAASTGSTATTPRPSAAPSGDDVPSDCIWGPGRNEPPQLPAQVGEHVGRKTLVLDLDETLVHSSFRPTVAADLVISVQLEGEKHKVYVRKRPGVDKFLQQVARNFEVVVYTASMAKYANPLLDKLDTSGAVAHRLFREACTRHSNGGHMKDLSRIGRDLRNVIIIDNSPICYALQPDNAIPIRTWRDDPSDGELLDLVPILHSLASVADITAVLRETVWSDD